MNKISFNLKCLDAQETKEIDGIVFSNAVLVELFIDEKPSFSFNFLEYALVVLSELVKSLSGDGCYLIFTSASGIADDGGWEGVDVSFNNGIVTWSFEVDDEDYHFSFDEYEYRNAINELQQKASDLPSALDFEPTEVFFPESWD